MFESVQAKGKETGYRPRALSDEQERCVNEAKLFGWLDQVARLEREDLDVVDHVVGRELGEGRPGKDRDGGEEGETHLDGGGGCCEEWDRRGLLVMRVVMMMVTSLSPRETFPSIYLFLVLTPIWDSHLLSP